MKQFFDRLRLLLRFKLRQMKTGCGKCEKCPYREGCAENAEKFSETGKEFCGGCPWNSVCKSELNR